MERLTRVIQPNIVVYVGKHRNYDVDIPAEISAAGVRDLLCRLAAYEDTDLTPEEVAGLCEMDKRSRMAQMLRWEEAEQEGHLLVLPCKVGDVIYGFHHERTILPMVVKWIETNDGWTVAAQYVPMAPKFYRFDDFGKTVFITREEAEAKLEEMRK